MLQLFFAEEPELVSRRVVMEQRRERLVVAAAKLSNIGTSAVDGGAGCGVYAGNCTGASQQSSQTMKVGDLCAHHISIRIIDLDQGRESVCTSAVERSLSLMVRVGKFGIGLVLTTDSHDANQLMVKDFQVVLCFFLSAGFFRFVIFNPHSSGAA